jgi:cellulose synthase/poly-beta-1,6-N-acetylglucosamine synthase-like glycosyltransferase
MTDLLQLGPWLLDAYLGVKHWVSAHLNTEINQFAFWTQWFFLGYFLALNGLYLMLNIAAFTRVMGYMKTYGEDLGPQFYNGLELPVTIIVPAYNEEATVVNSVAAQLQLDYGEYEVLVVADGPKDNTVAVLIEAFGLEPFPEAYRQRIPTAPVIQIYRSRYYSNLRVIHKENGGKADALNVGINAARYPIFCGVDADSLLQRDSLRRAVAPFLEDPTTIAVGGVIRVANDCQLTDALNPVVRIPSNMIARFQMVEYLRAFLFGRMGWQSLNAVLIISGAFGLFSKERVVAAGGYLKGSLGEDMELIVRLHRLMREENKPYRIAFVPDPVCWTEVPEDFKTMRNQRIRWQRGLAESLWLNKGLMFSRRGGAAGWLAFPFFVFFEFLGPIIELTGFVLMVLLLLLGTVNAEAFTVFMALAIISGVLLSLSAMVLEEISFSIYQTKRDLLKMMLAAVLENFGYRQLNAWWRMIGMWRWVKGFFTKNNAHQWGDMKRKGFK